MTEYVAMGSSFAAGPGLLPRVDGAPKASGRSQVNYAHLVSSKLRLALTDVTFSGATTADILATQVDAVSADTTLVTITGGGNDVGYLPGLTLASVPRALVSLLRQNTRQRQIRAELETKFSDLERGFAAIVDAIHAKAPGCRVVFVGYLTILPPDGRTETLPLPAEVAEWGRGVAARLSEATARIKDADFVDVGAASVTHHAWSAEPWTRKFHYTLRGGAAYHPNAAGMAAVADLVVAALA